MERRFHVFNEKHSVEVCGEVCYDERAMLGNIVCRIFGDIRGTGMKERKEN